MKKLAALLVCASVMAAMLVGCGSSAQQTGSSASGKKWIIATDTVFKPFEYTNENNEFVGIDVDILAAVAKDQGFEYDLQSLG